MKIKDTKIEIVIENDVATVKQYDRVSPQHDWVEIEIADHRNLVQLRRVFMEGINQKQRSVREKIREEKEKEPKKDM